MQPITYERSLQLMDRSLPMRLRSDLSACFEKDSSVICMSLPLAFHIPAAAANYALAPSDLPTRLPSTPEPSHPLSSPTTMRTLSARALDEQSFNSVI